MMTRQDTGTPQPTRQALIYFVLGQLSFFAALVVCLLLLPQGLWANHGFSYYGDYAITTLPYRLAFLVCGGGTLLASFFLPRGMPCRVLKYAFWLMPVLYLGIVITTVPHAAPNSALLDNIHRGIGVTLFVLQFGLGAWLAGRNLRDGINQLLLVLLFLGGLASLLALLYIIHYLIEAQMFFQLAFALLILRALSCTEKKTS